MSSLPPLSPPVSFAPTSHARTLLQLTYETDRALREGRLGAAEWFAFVSDLESLARKIEHRAPPISVGQDRVEKDKAEKDKAEQEARVLLFPTSEAVACESPSASSAFSVPSGSRFRCKNDGLPPARTL